MADPQDPYAAIAQPVPSADPYAAIAKPVQSDQPSATSRLGSNFLSGLGITSNEQAKNFFEHPIKTAMGMIEAQGELAKKAKDAYDKGDYMGAVQHGLNYLVPFIGQQTDQAGEQMKSGDIAGGIGRTLGVAAPMLAGSPEVRGTATDAASTALQSAKPAIAKTAQVASDIVDPDLTGIISPRLAHVQRALGRLSDAMQKPKAAPVPESEPVYPGASMPEHPGTFSQVPLGPETPPQEVLQANSLMRGPQAVVDPASALGKIPAAPAGPEPVYPGASLPEAPPAEVAQAKGLAQGGSTPPKPLAAALADLPAPAVHQAIQEMGPRVTIADVTARANEIAGAGIPRTLSGDSALTQILTGQDNANLLKIAKSRGINVTKEAQLRPGVADQLLIKKIQADMSPEELDEISAKYLETQRMGGHQFGDVGPEAWKSMSLQTYFPDVKIAAAVLKRTGKAIAANGTTQGAAEVPEEPVSGTKNSGPKANPPVEEDTLMEKMQKMLEEAQRKKMASAQ